MAAVQSLAAAHNRSSSALCLYMDERLGRYGFPEGHPFGTWRMEAFHEALLETDLLEHVKLCQPAVARQEIIEQFHTHDYVERVKRLSVQGKGYLDAGDTPAFPGVYEAAAAVVGAVTDAVRRVMEGCCRRAFVPIAGLHHAHRDQASGFCVFNDCAVAVTFLRHEFGIRRIAYVDIDAHHGDGVFYAFEDDPDLIFADIHEDGRYLFPGTGHVSETGKGAARGSKLNIPLPPGADDEAFLAVWPRVERFVRQAEPEFILMQCGADSIGGDPLTHLRYTAVSHRHAAREMCTLADSLCQGRIVGLGGGGYQRENIAAAWIAVAASFTE